jgi:hypothetical protein
MDVTLFGTFSHLIIMTPESGSTSKGRGKDINKGKFNQSDRDVLSLRKSSTVL